MRGLRTVTAAILLLTSSATTRAAAFISRAIFADGKLWLLDEDGRLSTLVRDHPHTPLPLNQPVLDLIRDHHDPVIVSCDCNICKNWLIKRWTKSEWKIEAKISVSGDSLLALANGDHVVLVTNRRLIDLKNGMQKVAAYKWDRPPGPMEGRITSTEVTPTHVWIGRDAGEWGGSLQRIDLATGASNDISRPDSSAPKSGSVVGNVNGLLVAPWNSHCVLVAQGLVHFMASGDILQVCGEKVLPFYRAGLEDNQSVPFYGLAKGRDGNVWAAGINGVYSLGKDGRARRIPMPRFVTTSDTSVGFATSDLALILTDTHRHASVSGSAPILVPLDE